MLTTDTVLPLYLGLVAVGALAAMAMVWTGRRVLTQVRRRVTHALMVAGWAPMQIRSLWDREALLTGGVTVVIGTLLAGMFSSVAEVPVGVPMLTAAGAAVVATLAGIVGIRRDTR